MKSSCSIHIKKGEFSQIFFPHILNMHKLQDLNIVAHNTLQDIVKIIMPEGTLQVISR